ncbi:MAG: DNA repair protein RecO [Elusimicrobiaceae bacterium]|nr:DNA repair protein RecO [Elusimicrobiaceae bacterium]
MIFTDSGVILYRQAFRESDRIVSIYTREHGRLNARLPGVSRQAGKLKALCEPLTWAEFRFYVKRGGVLSTITGGKIQSVFPAVHHHLKRTTLALHCCELLMRLTPLHQVSEDKFELLVTALTELEYGEPTPAFTAAFTLRLMMLAGFGLDHPVLQISPQFWQRMHEDKFSSLAFDDPQDLLALAKCNNVVRRFLDRYLTYPLNTLKNIGLEDVEIRPFQKTETPIFAQSGLHA